MNVLLDKLKRLLSQKVSGYTLRPGRNNEVYLSVPESGFSAAISVLKNDGFELASLFCVERYKPKEDFTLLYVLEKKRFGPAVILERGVHRNKTTSIASIFPSACWYEREIKDGFGIEFEEAFDTRRLMLHDTYPDDFHPLLKRIKNKVIRPRGEVPPEEEYPFKPVEGEGIYQIPVGPVHAGIIEPGHFRFSVVGETIFNLEIRLFYMHRGLEKLAEGKKPKEVVVIAEKVSGDETVANAFAYCQAVEQISDIVVPKRAQYLRMIFLEMERMYSLLSDLAGMVIDVAYPVGASPFFTVREELLRYNEKMTGSRFMRGSVCVGGIRQDIPSDLLSELHPFLVSCSHRCAQAAREVLSLPSVVDRFETTGVIKPELLSPLHLTGPIARASGQSSDTRLDHPYLFYAHYPPHIKVFDKGDVRARFETKLAEILDSARVCQVLISDIPDGKVCISKSIKDGSALSLVESPRGQNLHWVNIRHGRIDRYKVRTASFCNWQAIEHAVLGNIVPDFPVINKSLNLSYAGTDM